MNALYVFIFESATSIVTLDVFEDDNNNITHTVRKIKPNKNRPSAAKESYCNASNDFTAFLYYSELVKTQKEIAAVNGFDFSICNEHEINRFLFKLLYRVEMTKDYEINDLTEFAEFAGLIER